MAAPDCSSLFEFVFAKAPASAKKPSDYQDGDSGADICQQNEKSAACAHSNLVHATTIDDALRTFKDERSAYGKSPPVKAIGPAQFDIASAGAETLQILGQIVVNRASAKAYGLLQARLERLLDCPNESDQKQQAAEKEKEATKTNSGHAEPAAATTQGSETKFPSTCNVLVSLRIQDIAMAPRLLAAALAQDVFRFLGPLDTIALGAEARSVATLLVIKPNLPRELAVREVVDALFGYAAS